MGPIEFNENLKEEFLSKVKKHQHAKETGEYRTANKINKELILMYKHAKDANQLSLFRELINTDDYHVKLWAAVLTIEDFPDPAVKALTELLDSPTLASLSAQAILHMWKEGTWGNFRKEKKKTHKYIPTIRTPLRYFLENINRVPRHVKFSEIQNFPRMEERFFDVEGNYGDIVGMNIDSVDFCPNFNPPDLNQEILPWLWIIHPELESEILNVADEQLKKIITEYVEAEDD